MKKERYEWDTNRSCAKKPRKGQFWCGNCDEYLVNPGQKCPRCGKRNLPRIDKK